MTDHAIESTPAQQAQDALAAASAHVVREIIAAREAGYSTALMADYATRLLSLRDARAWLAEQTQPAKRQPAKEKTR